MASTGAVSGVAVTEPGAETGTVQRSLHSPAHRRLTLAQVARREGVATSTLTAYKAHGWPRGNPFPHPDGHDEWTGRPYWYEDTISRWHARRPGPGKRTDLK